LTKTADGGYALAGAGGNNGVMLVKTDGVGNMQWSQTYGGTGSEPTYLCTYANAVVQTPEGGYALAGYYNYFFTPFILDRPAASGDAWLIKTNALGALQWSNNYGGSGFDGAFGIVIATDGGYTLAGYTSRGGDYRNASIGFSDDLWIIKTEEYSIASPTITPNPTSNPTTQPTTNPTNNPTADPTISPTQTPSSNTPSPTPFIPELSWFIVFPLVIFALFVAAIISHRKTS
jgi:hypothetical protein